MSDDHHFIRNDRRDLPDYLYCIDYIRILVQDSGKTPSVDVGGAKITNSADIDCSDYGRLSLQDGSALEWNFVIGEDPGRNGKA